MPYCTKYLFSALANRGAFSFKRQQPHATVFYLVFTGQKKALQWQTRWKRVPPPNRETLSSSSIRNLPAGISPPTFGLWVELSSRFLISRPNCAEGQVGQVGKRKGRENTLQVFWVTFTIVATKWGKPNVFLRPPQVSFRPRNLCLSLRVFILLIHTHMSHISHAQMGISDLKFVGV